MILKISQKIKHTCNIQIAFSIESASDGKPSFFQISCSLSELSISSNVNFSIPNSEHQFSRMVRRASSGSLHKYVMKAADIRDFKGSSLCCRSISFSYNVQINNNCNYANKCNKICYNLFFNKMSQT